ncbi:MAG: homoserine dehydrogenase [Coriobacteriales bacterium]|jgi:homoserine dehydrogenase|nr:homoserine dehydrogenase [Coriobacteriales bacterium]
MRTIKVGLIGLGTVGGGVVRILKEHHDDFLRDQGVDIQLVACAARERAEAERLGVADIFTTDGFELINNPDIDIIIELVGGTGIARRFVFAALEAKKRVVTANKAIMATDGHELLALAGQNGLELAFEASVGGGIPIIGALRNSLIGNRIESVIGIVNGTTNYMLTQMSQSGADYASVLARAQDLGYAEADPTADVEGGDAAAKIAILTTLAFNTEVVLEQVPTEGITQLTPKDLDNARQLGYSIKLLAIANRTSAGIDMRVHPTMLPLAHPLSSVNGVFNAIFVVGDSVGETMFYGEGAGAGAAASAVVGDLIEVAQRITYNITRPYIRFGTEQLPLKPLDDIVCSYYLRLPVPDRVGVVAATATAFANHGVSINRMMQLGEKDGPVPATPAAPDVAGDPAASANVLAKGDVAEENAAREDAAREDAAEGTTNLIYVTHPTREGDLKAVLAEIQSGGILSGTPVLIRIMD